MVKKKVRTKKERFGKAFEGIFGGTSKKKSGKKIKGLTPEQIRKILTERKQKTAERIMVARKRLS